MSYTTEVNHEVVITINKSELGGFLYIPKNAIALVLFVHGSGSSRFSTRNQSVAKKFNNEKFATLLFDLLTTEEANTDDETRELRFDIKLLSSRLCDVTKWCLSNLNNLPIVYFGASTGASAALVAAAKDTTVVKAIVSRGGRTDLADDSLPYVTAPTLMVVGSADAVVLHFNRAALSQLTCIKDLEVVAGASHLFEEPGALDAVASLALNWYMHHLVKNHIVIK